MKESLIKYFTKGIKGIMELESFHHRTISDEESTIRFTDKESGKVLSRNLLEKYCTKKTELVKLLETSHSQLLSHIPKEWMTEIKLTNQLQERSQEDSSRKEESSNESQPIQPTPKQMTDTDLGAFFNIIAEIINPFILQATTVVYK